MDKKELTATVLLDMSKAFDSISHENLISKLLHGRRCFLPVSSMVLQLPKRQARINSTLSEPLTVTSGVPQGSILGPLLFYVNDLPAVPRKCSSQCYVDDTKLLVSFKIEDKINAVIAMNEDLLNVSNWCFNNYLLLNPDKTKLMVFGSRQMLPNLRDFTLSLLGKEFVPIQAAKDLGVTLDPHLTYNDHIVNTVSSSMSCLGQILKSS